jgi:hypothetical protein
MERRQFEYLCLRKQQQKETNVNIIRPFDCTLTSETVLPEIHGFRCQSPRFVANNITYQDPVIPCSNYIAPLLPKFRPYILRNVGVQQMLIVSDKFTKCLFIISVTAFETHSLNHSNKEWNFLFQYRRIHFIPPKNP